MALPPSRAHRAAMIATGQAPFAHMSVSVLFYPGHILVHPILQELSALLTNIAGTVEQPFLYLDKGFRLAERRHIQIGKNITQMLLSHGSAGGADGSAQHTRWLPAHAF